MACSNRETALLQGERERKRERKRKGGREGGRELVNQPDRNSCPTPTQPHCCAMPTSSCSCICMHACLTCKHTRRYMYLAYLITRFFLLRDWKPHNSHSHSQPDEGQHEHYNVVWRDRTGEDYGSLPLRMAFVNPSELPIRTWRSGESNPLLLGLAKR